MDQQETTIKSDANSEEATGLTNVTVLKQLCKFSLPVMAGFSFYPAYVMIDTALLGRYFESEAYLASFGLALSAIGILLESVGIGMTSCVETLVSQAYGANDHYMCRVYLNRQYFINTIGYLVLSVPGYFLSGFFFSSVLDQRDEISHLAQRTFGLIAIGIYFQCQAQTTVFYSIAMNEPSVLLISFGLATLVFVPTVLVLTLVYDCGYGGICWATVMHLFLRFVFAFALISFKDAFKLANQQTRFFERATV